MILIYYILLMNMHSGISGDVSEKTRTAFHQEEHSQKRLENLMKNFKQDTGIIPRAYLGISEIMMAEHQLWPVSKYEYFVSGKKKIEAGISAEPLNPEIRYIRLLMQLNAPDFLNYHSDIPDDIQIFTGYIPVYNISRSWKLKFANLLLVNENLPASAKAKIRLCKTEILKGN